ncbi:MAG: hypothetical protein LVS60_00115 [Nodosilinea sp. LVE1205-7]
MRLSPQFLVVFATSGLLGLSNVAVQASPRASSGVSPTADQPIPSTAVTAASFLKPATSQVTPPALVKDDPSSQAGPTTSPRVAGPVETAIDGYRGAIAPSQKPLWPELTMPTELILPAYVPTHP